MIYTLNDKYYLKISGYLVEVIPSIVNGELDFKPTQNKIEITSNLYYQSVNKDEVKTKLEHKVDEVKLKKSNERTHKFKFNNMD